MINCGMMAVDHRELSWRLYCELLDEWNSRHSADATNENPDADAALRRIMKARANV